MRSLVELLKFQKTQETNKDDVPSLANIRRRNLRIG